MRMHRRLHAGIRRCTHAANNRAHRVLHGCTALAKDVRVVNQHRDTTSCAFSFSSIISSCHTILNPESVL